MWRRVVIDNKPWPTFWRSDAFAASLGLAASGRLSLAPAKLTTAAVAASTVGIAYFAKVPMPHAGLQATIPAAFAAELCVPNFGKAAAERWSRILGMKF